MRKSPQDIELVNRFLAAIDGLSPLEAGERTPVSHETIRKWRIGDWKRLEAKTRRSLEEWLGQPPAQPSLGYKEGFQAAINRMQSALDSLAAEVATLPTPAEATPIQAGTARRARAAHEEAKRIREARKDDQPGADGGESPPPLMDPQTG